jgi:hypothetical protein
MMPTHQELIGLLACADTGFVAWGFATTCTGPSRPVSERSDTKNVLAAQ